MKKVCVIGAGPSGLTTIKQLLDEGHTPVCYERESEVGGVLNYREHKSGVYDNAWLTISNYLMCFSDYPPEGHRYHWHHSEYKAYLIRYAEKFGLQEFIHFHSEVIRMRRLDNGYEVTVKDLKKQIVHSDVFDAVAVCTGSNQHKKIPKIKGIEQFRGEVMHASEYKNHHPFKGKNVVCIGMGESSADITREIGQVAENCYLAIRSYPYLIPRILNTSSSDGWTSRMFLVFTHPSENLVYYTIGLFMMCCMFLQHVMTRMILSKDALKQKIDAFNQPTSTKMLDLDTIYDSESLKLIKSWTLLSGGKKFATKNVTFVPYVLNGRIKANASGINYVQDDTVFFNDGRSVRADILVACTGYQDNFDYIEGFHIRDNNIRNLFMQAFPPDLPHCAFIGWARPITGGQPACAEMAARFFALLLSNKVSLPENIYDLIEQDKKFYAEDASNSQNLNTVVEWKRYMETLAELIGCKVKLWKYIFKPALFTRLLYGSLIPSQYRLEGPHADYVMAKKTILGLPITLPFTISIPISLAAISYKLRFIQDDPLDHARFVKYDYFPECALQDEDIDRFRFVAKDS